jgi:hypothetical protein
MLEVCVSVAQLDRAADFGSAGWGFESLQARCAPRIDAVPHRKTGGLPNPFTRYAKTGASIWQRRRQLFRREYRRMASVEVSVVFAWKQAKLPAYWIKFCLFVAW